MSRYCLPLLLLSLSACAEHAPVGTDKPTADASNNKDAPDDTDPWDEADDDDDQADDDAPSDSDSNDNTDPEDPEEPEEPGEIPEGDDEIEGAWTTVDELLTEDHCDMEDYVLQGTGQQLILDVVGDGELEITDYRGVNDCTYDSDAFDCDARIFEDHTPSEDYGLDATILLESHSYGSFEGIDSLFMQTDVTANCEGDDCWLVEIATASFPCQMRLWVAAEAN